jgi:hypothetical protein
VRRRARATRATRVRRAVRDRSAAESASRGRKERQRRAESEANGVVCARVFQERATPERSATRSGTAFKRWSAAALSVEASSARTVGRSSRGFGDRAQRTARLAGRARGHRERRALRTRPQGAKRPEPQAERSERTRRPSRRAASVSATGCARLRRGRQPAGRSGVPAGLTRAGTTHGPGAQRTDHVTCRRGSYRSAAFARHSCRARRPRRGRTPTARSDEGAEEDADGVTDRRSLRRRAGATCAACSRRCFRTRVAGGSS